MAFKRVQNNACKMFNQLNQSTRQLEMKFDITLENKNQQTYHTCE